MEKSPAFPVSIYYHVMVQNYTFCRKIDLKVDDEKRTPIYSRAKKSKKRIHDHDKYARKQK